MLRELAGPVRRRLPGRLRRSAEHDDEKHEISGAHAPYGQRHTSQ
ncbi:hypothetical protein GZL_00482 [Streptomyces sp. 769]|nr:hypothetical protein GZL_00482 [Streptomyces sp. 769]